MARARNLKPGFFRNADLVELSFETRLLFIGLWTIADREGRLEDRPKQIKMELFPADNMDCDACIQQLSDINMVKRYEVDGIRYLQVTNFTKHQNPHRDEKASTIPKWCEPDANTVQTPCEPDANTVAIGLNPESLLLNPDSKIKSIPPNGGSDLAKDLFDSAKAIGIKPSLVGKAIKEVGEIEAMAAIEQSVGLDNPTNAFAASIRNRKARIEQAGINAKPRLFDPSVLSL